MYLTWRGKNRVGATPSKKTTSLLLQMKRIL